MRIKMPAPLNGWRVFAGEVGTIVLGVLLALGAQELAQSIHWRNEVRQTRKALDTELARNLANFDFRMRQRACATRRLNELEKWAKSFRTSRPLTLKREIVPPPYFAVRTAAWNVTDGEILARIPLDAKLSYAALYDGMANFQRIKDEEAGAWETVIEYQGSHRLDETDLRTLDRAIRELQGRNETLEAYDYLFEQKAQALGIRPERNIEAGAAPIFAKTNREFCQALL